MEREPARDTHRIHPLDMEEGLDTSSNGTEDDGVRNRNENRRGCVCVYEREDRRTYRKGTHGTAGKKASQRGSLARWSGQSPGLLRTQKKGK